MFNNWITYLNDYTGSQYALKGKTTLELGPGSDLGIGVIMLLKGAKKYNAIDVNNLVQLVPDRFYDELFTYAESQNTGNVTNIEYVRRQLRLTQEGKNEQINYICRKDFDLSVFKGEDIDIVFSQAALEHFDDIERTCSQLSRIVKSGAVLITEIDLKTHTRWIRDLDPQNIYRYSDFFLRDIEVPWFT